jgi:hypothetical protein
MAGYRAVNPAYWPGTDHQKCLVRTGNSPQVVGQLDDPRAAGTETNAVVRSGTSFSMVMGMPTTFLLLHEDRVAYLSDPSPPITIRQSGSETADFFSISGVRSLLSPL